MIAREKGSDGSLTPKRSATAAIEPYTPKPEDKAALIAYPADRWTCLGAPGAKGAFISDQATSGLV